MKNKVLKFLLFLFFSFISTQSSYSKTINEIKIACSSIPHSKILSFIAPQLKKQGIMLRIVPIDDPVLPNELLKDKAVDANFYQTLPYLEEQKRVKDYNFVSVVGVHIEPLGLYSKKIKNIQDLRDNAVIAIPHDTQNAARSLILLHNHGIIILKNPNNLISNQYDIIKNPKHLKFKTISAPFLIKALDDVDAVIINGNYALLGGYHVRDSVISEDSKDSPYANILVVRKGDENKPEILKLKEALRSETLRKFIAKQYQGDIIPVF